MTSSQKAFEDIILKKFKDRWICDILERKINGKYKLATVLRAWESFEDGWQARGKLDEEICEKVCEEVRFSESKATAFGAELCAEEIRKRGGE